MELMGSHNLEECTDAAASAASEVQQEEDEQVEAAIAAFSADFDEVCEGVQDSVANEFEQEKGARSGVVGDSSDVSGLEGDFCALR